MKRRDYLLTASALFATSLSGCLGDDEPEEPDNGENGDDPGENGDDPGENGDDPGENGDDDEPATPGEQAVEALREELEAAGIEIRDLFYGPGLIELDYTTAADDMDDVDGDIETIGTAFADVIDEFEEDQLLMECYALSEDDDFIAYFEVQLAWAREYADGDISAEEYFERIEDTVS